ncbi:MAG: enoyl-CoA hydratase/isomerase family protein [Ectothiorhodospiraceae bacterium]|nr:enoyl-CoA hydratase/isomerase family protein [Ectothiorhodospiraceae bacterium]
MNALHPMAHAELARVFDAFAADHDAWIAVITGAGDRAFCTGTDLKYMAAHGPVDPPPSGFAGLTSRTDLDKPVVACVNGLALGGGFEIVMACDLVVAAEHAEFGFPEPRVGLAALGGGLHRLARQLPLKRAMDLILTARRVGAAEGERLGFVNRVVPRERLVDETRILLEAMLACAPLALRASKATAMASLDTPSLAEALAREHPAATRMLASDDAREGPRAFAEKRPPRWTGR